MRPATGQVLPPNTADLVTQSMRCVNSTNGEKGLLMKLRRLGPMETHLGTSGTTSDAEDSEAENQTLRGTHYHDLPHYFPEQKSWDQLWSWGRADARGVRCGGLRIGYVCNGTPVQEMGQIGGFPAGY